MRRVMSSMLAAVCFIALQNIGVAIAENGSPFEQQIRPPGTRIIVVDPKRHAWAAYDADGSQVRWGPASLGKNYCPDIGRRCHTATGRFAIYSKGGPGCKSTKFPIPRGGAPMPYCMFFHGGFAIHGANEVPNYNASHGCVRVIPEDAAWLNLEFAEIGTPVIVLPYFSQEDPSDDPY